MSSNSASTEFKRSADANQRFVDKQMAGVIEAIMVHAYSLSNGGLIPSNQQVKAYISSLAEVSLLQIIRRHPGAASTQARMASDADLLRWAGFVGQQAAR